MRRLQVSWLLVALLGALLVTGPVVAQSFNGSSAPGDSAELQKASQVTGLDRVETKQEPLAPRTAAFEKTGQQDNPVDRQTQRDLPGLDRPADVTKPSGKVDPLGPGSTVSVTIGDLPAGKSISIFFDATVVNPFPNGVAEVSQQGFVSGNFATFPTDDPDDATGDTDPTATAVLAAPILAGATKTVSDAPFGDADGMAQPGEILTYTIALTNSGNGGDSTVNINDVLPPGLTLDLGSVAVALGGGAGGDSDTSAGNTVNVTVASVPGAGGSVTVTFNATVDDPVPAGIEVLSNTAQIQSPKTPLFDTTQADIPVEAVPDFTLDKDDGGVNVDPGSSVVYTLTYTNTGDQDASNVVLEDTVPVGGLFDAGASSAGWDCFDGDPEGTLCTISVGTVAGNGGTAAVDFAVEVVPPQDAPPTIDNTATVRDDGAGSGGVPVEATDSDSTPVNDLLPPTVANVDTIKTNGDGTLEECESVANSVFTFDVDFSEGMTEATVEDIANWQVVGSGPDLDLSTTACGAAQGDDVTIAIDTVTYDALTTSARVELDVSPWLDDGPYRLMACSGAGGIEDVAGNELDGDGDFTGGDDFVRNFRIDQIDAFANGHFDCSLDDWVPVLGTPSSIVHDPTTDMDNASISGSAQFHNEAGSTQIALGQCLEVGGGAVHDFTGFVFLETPAISVGVIRTCEFFPEAACGGAALPTQAFFDTISTDGVWIGFAGVVSAPPIAQSTLCQVTLENGLGAPFDGFLDDFSFNLLQSPIVFEDGFESGDTSAWDTTVP